MLAIMRLTLIPQRPAGPADPVMARASRSILIRCHHGTPQELSRSAQVAADLRGCWLETNYVVGRSDWNVLRARNRPSGGTACRRPPPKFGEPGSARAFRRGHPPGPMAPGGALSSAPGARPVAWPRRWPAVEAMQHADDGCGVCGVGEEELHHDEAERSRRPAHAVLDLGAERDREPRRCSGSGTSCLLRGRPRRKPVPSRLSRIPGWRPCSWSRAGAAGSRPGWLRWGRRRLPPLSGPRSGTGAARRRGARSVRHQQLPEHRLAVRDEE